MPLILLFDVNVLLVLIAEVDSFLALVELFLDVLQSEELAVIVVGLADEAFLLTLFS